MSLRAFQSLCEKGPVMLPAFMEQLFPKDRDILILGTVSAERIEDYQRAEGLHRK